MRPAAPAPGGLRLPAAPTCPHGGARRGAAAGQGGRPTPCKQRLQRPRPLKFPPHLLAAAQHGEFHLVQLVAQILRHDLAAWREVRRNGEAARLGATTGAPLDGRVRPISAMARPRAPCAPISPPPRALTGEHRDVLQVGLAVLAEPGGLHGDDLGRGGGEPSGGAGGKARGASAAGGLPCLLGCWGASKPRRLRSGRRQANHRRRRRQASGKS